MSDYGDFCREQREESKKSKSKARDKAHAKGGIIEKIESFGAYELTDGIYRLGCFDIYVYKNSACNYVTKKHCSVEEAIKNRDEEYEYEAPKRRGGGRKNWLEKHLELKTTGVYRFEPLNIDVYPNKNWARNYKTNESYSVEEVRKMVKEYIINKSDKE